MNYSSNEILQNKITAVNQLHHVLNKLAPKIQAKLSEGFRINAAGVFFKKDNENINTLIQMEKAVSTMEQEKIMSTIRLYVNVSGYSIVLHGDIHYSTSQFSCDYYTKEVYLMQHKENVWNKFIIEPLIEKYTIEEVKKRQAYLDKINCIIERLEGLKSVYTRNFSPFF